MTPLSSEDMDTLAREQPVLSIVESVEQLRLLAHRCGVSPECFGIGAILHILIVCMLHGEFSRVFEALYAIHLDAKRKEDLEDLMKELGA